MCSIPKFPSSKKLTLADQAEVQNFVEKFPPYSDYNFTSLYSYNVENNIELSWLNNNLVVLQPQKAPLHFTLDDEDRLAPKAPELRLEERALAHVLWASKAYQNQWHQAK